MKKSTMFLLSFIFSAVVLCFLALPFFLVPKQVDFSSVVSQIQTMAEQQGLVENTQQQFSAQYRMKENEFEQFISYRTDSNMEVEEITMIYAPGQTANALAKAQAHIKKLKLSFAGYGAEQTHLLNNATVIQKGDYVLCIVSEHPELHQLAELF